MARKYQPSAPSSSANLESRTARNAHYPPHTHAGLTTHLITNGDMALWYPDDPSPEKITFGVGARVDVDAGRVHQVQIGSRGCTYVIGE